MSLRKSPLVRAPRLRPGREKRKPATPSSGSTRTFCPASIALQCLVLNWLKELWALWQQSQQQALKNFDYSLLGTTMLLEDWAAHDENSTNRGRQQAVPLVNLPNPRTCRWYAKATISNCFAPRSDANKAKKTGIKRG